MVVIILTFRLVKQALTQLYIIHKYTLYISRTGISTTYTPDYDIYTDIYIYIYIYIYMQCSIQSIFCVFKRMKFIIKTYCFEMSALF